MPIVNKFTAARLIKQTAKMFKGMLRAKITRKVKDTSNDIEPGLTITTIYKEIDCDIQPITRRDTEGLETAPAGNVSVLDKMGYLPRFIFEENEWEELFIYEDDQLELLSTNGKKYKIKRVDDTYEDHLELLLELLKQ